MSLLSFLKDLGLAECMLVDGVGERIFYACNMFAWIIHICTRESEYLNVLTMYLTSMPVWDDYAVHFSPINRIDFYLTGKEKRC